MTTKQNHSMNLIRTIATAALCIGMVLSGAQASAATKVAVPTPFVSSGTYASYIRLSWAKISTATGGYYIRRGTSRSYAKAKNIKKVGKTTTSYNDKSAKNLTVYYYWICPIRSGKVYHNTARYGFGYRYAKSSSSKSSSSGYISGPSSLRRTQTGHYYLYVNGKRISATSVSWKKSGTSCTMYDAGSYGRLYAGNPAKSGYKVTVKATYKGKTYSKKVTLYK